MISRRPSSSRETPTRAPTDSVPCRRSSLIARARRAGTAYASEMISTGLRTLVSQQVRQDGRVRQQVHGRSLAGQDDDSARRVRTGNSRSVSRSASSGRFVASSAAKRNPGGTINQQVCSKVGGGPGVSSCPPPTSSPASKSRRSLTAELEHDHVERNGLVSASRGAVAGSRPRRSSRNGQPADRGFAWGCAVSADGEMTAASGHAQHLRGSRRQCQPRSPGR